MFEGDPRASPHNTPDSCTVIVSVVLQETITQSLRAWLCVESSFQTSYLENGDQSTHLRHLSMCGVVTWSCAHSLYSFKICCCLTVAYIYVITVISTAVPAPLLPEPSCQQVSLLLSCPTVCSLLIQLEFLALPWLGDTLLEKRLHHWRKWHSLLQQLLRPHVCLPSGMCYWGSQSCAENHGHSKSVSECLCHVQKPHFAALALTFFAPRLSWCTLSIGWVLVIFGHVDLYWEGLRPSHSSLDFNRFVLPPTSPFLSPVCEGLRYPRLTSKFLCNWRWPWIPDDPSASTCQMLGLQGCESMSGVCVCVG